jgi:hypothetical protein
MRLYIPAFSVDKKIQFFAEIFILGKKDKTAKQQNSKTAKQQNRKK